MNFSKFCTCKNLDCPLHPTKHDRGCAPCIAKNLKLREGIPCIGTTKYTVQTAMQKPPALIPRRVAFTLQLREYSDKISTM